MWRLSDQPAVRHGKVHLVPVDLGRVGRNNEGKTAVVDLAAVAGSGSRNDAGGVRLLAERYAGLCVDPDGCLGSAPGQATSITLQSNLSPSR